MTEEKKKKIIIFIALPAFVLAAIYSTIFLYQKKQRELRLAEAERQGLIKRAPVSFDAELKKFYPDLKMALVATRGNSKETASSSLQAAIKKWRDIADYYRYNQPRDYVKTMEWTSKINNIYENIIRAENNMRVNRAADAHAEMITAAHIINAIKTENNKSDISIEMLSFYEQVKAISDSAGKTEVMSKLMELKLNFAELKGFNAGPEYSNGIQEIESIIGALDKLDGPDFNAAKAKLEPAYSKIFLEFG